MRYDLGCEWMRPKTTDPRNLTVEILRTVMSKFPARPEWNGIILSPDDEAALKLMAARAMPVSCFSSIHFRTNKAVPVGLAVLTDGGRFVRVVRLEHNPAVTWIGQGERPAGDCPVCHHPYTEHFDYCRVSATG